MLRAFSKTRTRLLGILLTLVFLALSFYKVDLAELGAALQRANYVFILPAAAVTLVGYVLRTLRWRVILTRHYSPGLGSLFAILMIGFATNNLLPARLGELARAYLLGRRTGQRKTLSMATIILERVFDGLVLITLLGVVSALPVVRLPGWGQEVQRLSSLIFLLATAVVLLLLTQERFAERALRLLVRPLPSGISDWIEAAFAAFVTGLGSLRRARVLAAVILLSLAIWTLEALSYFTLITAFGLPLDGLQWVAAPVLVLVIVNLGIMIPSAPGYVGTFQFFAMSALAIFNIPRESGLALGIVSHIMQYVLVTGVGLYYLSRLHLSLGRIAEQPAEPELEPVVLTSSHGIGLSPDDRT